MSPIQHLGLTWLELVERVECSGCWPLWVAAEPELTSPAGLKGVVAIVADRDDPVRADALLAALVRLGAASGGNDQDAAHAVALLLENGAARLARQLSDLSDNIDELVAGQVWLQIRDFSWRRRRRAIAQNILMDARRAVLADLGVDTRRRRHGVDVIHVDTVEIEAIDCRSGILAYQSCTEPWGDELSLEGFLVWATGQGVVSHQDAAILRDLAGLELDGAVRGLNSAAEIRAVATRRGVNEKTVRRGRDRAIRSLVNAREAYLRECA